MIKYGEAILLNAGLGYLYVLFTFTSVRWINSTEPVLLWACLVLGGGNLVFWRIVKKVNPDQGWRKPLDITSHLSFLAAVIISAIGI